MTTRHDTLVLDLSVLTPSYEYERFIADGSESVIQEQGLSLQYIIQDAGSGDKTFESCALRRSSGKGVRDRSGPVGRLNRALPRRPDWIAWLTADEYHVPDGLRVLVEEGERSGADIV
jgi:glycosyltransferase involved in cell wall biosynthesis